MSLIIILFRAKLLMNPIVQDEAVDSFEDYVVEKIDRYRGSFHR